MTAIAPLVSGKYKAQLKNNHYFVKIRYAKRNSNLDKSLFISVKFYATFDLHEYVSELL